MNPFIPAFLQKNIAAFGAEGADWLARLPERIAECERAWDCRVGPAFDHGGAVSWVAPVTLADGAEAVLKIGMPSEEARFESHALRFWDGSGAVRLLRASDDGFALLLERCRPGTDLWSLPEAEGDAVARRMLARLWQEPDPEAPFVSLADSVAAWWKSIPQLKATAACDDDVAAAIVARGNELVATQSRRVLLHGDFHPGNVLATQASHGEPWRFIDPKPLVGEPAYDLAQWLYNRARFVIDSPDAVAILRQRIDHFAAELDLDPTRIAGWALVKAFGWECGPEFVTLFHAVLRAQEARLAHQ